MKRKVQSCEKPDDEKGGRVKPKVNKRLAPKVAPSDKYRRPSYDAVMGQRGGTAIAIDTSSGIVIKNCTSNGDLVRLTNATAQIVHSTEHSGQFVENRTIAHRSDEYVDARTTSDSVNGNNVSPRNLDA